MDKKYLSIDQYHQILNKDIDQKFNDDYQDYDYKKYLSILDDLFINHQIDLYDYFDHDQDLFKLIKMIDDQSISIYQYLSNISGLDIHDYYLMILLSDQDIKKLIRIYFNYHDYFNNYYDDQSIRLMIDYQDLISDLIIDHFKIIKKYQFDFYQIIDNRLSDLDKIDDLISDHYNYLSKIDYIKKSIKNISDYYFDNLDNFIDDQINDKDLDQLDDIIDLIDQFKSINLID